MRNIKIQILLVLSFTVCMAVKGQSLRSIDLNYKDTIYVSKTHISYLDPRGIDLVELVYKSSYIDMEKTTSGIIKILATDDFSMKTPNVYPVAFITPEETILKIIKYQPALQSYLYHFSKQKENGRGESHGAIKESNVTSSKMDEYGYSRQDENLADLFRRLNVKDQNTYVPFFKNKIEACIGGVRHDSENYYFIIKIINKGNKPFAADYLHMTLQQEEGRKIKNSLSQKKAVQADILNKMTFGKNDQGFIIVKTPLINVNDDSYLFLELFDNQSVYDKEDVRTISFKIKNNVVAESKPI